MATADGGERDAKAVEALVERLSSEGYRTKRLRVSHAFHSAHMEPMLEAFGRVASSCTYGLPQTELVSLLTGEVAQGTEFRNAEYWVKQVREGVRFTDGMKALEGRGVTHYLECGPEGVLSALGAACVSGEGAAHFVTSQRKDRSEVMSLMRALGELQVGGVDVDWEHGLRTYGGRLVEAPTYAFQREHYWLTENGPHGDVKSVGLSPTGHALLGAQTALADSDGYVFSSLISTRTQPWLKDHAVLGTVLVPGTALVDMVLSAGRQVGTPVLSELTLSAPLSLSESPVQVQLSVHAPDDEGRRRIGIYSRVEGATTWIEHASGLLSAEAREIDATDEGFTSLRVWPPLDGRPIDLSDLYDRLQALGLEYGPAFQGLVEAYRVGDVVHGRVQLSESLSITDYGVHPALFDAALHALAAAAAIGESALLPFSWSNVVSYAAGVRELRLRAQVSRLDASTLTASMHMSDSEGAPVAHVGALHLRPVSAAQLAGASRGALEHLYRVQMQSAPLGEPATGEDIAVLGESSTLASVLGASSYRDVEALVASGARVPKYLVVDVTRTPPCSESDEAAQAMQATTSEALRTLQRLLSEPSLASAELLWVTRTTQGGIEDLSQGALWGLVRTAASEHTERAIRLLDIGNDAMDAQLLARAVSTSTEPELILHHGSAQVPRLVRATPSGPKVEPGPELSRGTTLITGGTGELGQALARHLVTGYGVRHLVLTSRRGKEAPGAQALIDELRALGADTVDVRACDISDREEVAGVLESLPAPHPLTAVFHLAGILDDGVLEGQTPERLTRVLMPKVAGALHLHELTRELPLTAFVVFSSAAGTLGNPGQSSYAAANAALDALALHRHAQNLPALSLAWGLWQPSGLGMTSHLSDAELARMARQGAGALSVAEGMQLLDAALLRPEPTLAPIRLDLRALRRAVENSGHVPALLRQLVRTNRPRTAQGETAGALRARLASLPAAERLAALLPRVQKEIADVLGLARASDLDPRLELKALGLDSLMAVEIRNRLAALMATTLRPTAVFEQPTAQALAMLLLERALTDEAPPREPSPHPRSAEQVLPILRSTSLAIERRETTFTSRSTTLCVSTWGDPSHPAVVCLHGINDQGPVWNDVACGLVAAGHYVVAPDLRGHGLSSHSLDGAGTSLFEHVADLEFISNAMRLHDFCLVGHSLGTMVASGYAAYRPERVRSLCLVEPVLPPEGRIAIVDRLNLAVRRRGEMRDAAPLGGKQEAFRRMEQLHPTMPPALRDMLAERALVETPNGLAWRGERNPLSVDFIRREDYLGLLGHLPVAPLLVFGNASEFAVEGDVDRIKGTIAGARAITLEGTHSVHYEQPEHITSLILGLPGRGISRTIHEGESCRLSVAKL